MEKRESGTVRRYDKNKGYGFIEPDYGKDVFVHQSGLLEARWLNEGDRVEYRVIQGKKGLQAVDVIVVDE